METLEVKPCPYCGGEADISYSSGAWMASCKDMDSCGNMGFVETKLIYWEDMVEKWNRRYCEAPQEVGKNS